MDFTVNKTIIKSINHPLYEERIENWDYPNMQGATPVRIHCGYNLDGHYIGDIRTTRHLCDKYGIKPELIDPEHSVCSVGYSAKHNKWYGWSHRAISGFQLGDKIFEEEFGNDNTLYIQHGIQPITNMDEARTAACRFAQSVASDGSFKFTDTLYQENFRKYITETALKNL